MVIKNRKGFIFGAIAVVGIARATVEGSPRTTELKGGQAYLEEVVGAVETMSIPEMKLMVNSLEQRFNTGDAAFSKAKSGRFTRPPKVLGRADLVKVNRSRARGG